MNQSLEDYYISLWNQAADLCYEANPERKGWELHEMKCPLTITNSNYIKTDQYYLYTLYDQQNKISDLFDFIELYPKRLDNWLEGRMSLQALLNTTSDTIESELQVWESKIKEAQKLRSSFIKTACS